MDAGKKILIVEDDPYIREVYEEILKESGYSVTIAADGEEGLAKLKEGGFDLTLLDIMMPKKNGLELLSEIKNTPIKQANGPIIVLTNLANDPIIKDAIDKGATDYFIKADLNPDQLVSHIQKFLQG